MSPKLDNVIYVPGQPAKWSPPSLPTTLKKDSGYQFVDQNAYRVPKYPFEPIFRSITFMNPSFNFTDVDIIANRNSLRKSFDFISRKSQESFGMDLDLVKNTLLITRRERDARTMIHGALNSGHGHNFEGLFTKHVDGQEQSSSHHRVIRYNFGSLNCPVRFEVDACYEAEDTSADGEFDHHRFTPKYDPEEHLASATCGWTQLSLNLLPKSQPQSRSIKAIQSGTLVPSPTTAEIKALKKHASLFKYVPQLWFGRTSHLLIGKHIDGFFNSIEYTHAARKFQDWEAKNQDQLRKLATLMSDLRDITKKTRRGAAVLVFDKKTKSFEIRVFERVGGNGVLPEETKLRYWKDDKK